jgi:hypothetical protein
MRIYMSDPGGQKPRESVAVRAPAVVTPDSEGINVQLFEAPVRLKKTRCPGTESVTGATGIV